MKCCLNALYYHRIRGNKYLGSSGESARTTHLEHLEEILFRYFETFELLLLLDNTFGKSFEGFVIGSLNDTELAMNAGERESEAVLKRVGSSPIASSHSHFVEETIIGRRTHSEMTSIVLLATFSENVCRRMPPNLLTCSMRVAYQYTRHTDILGRIKAYLQGVQSRGVRVKKISRKVAQDPRVYRQPASDCVSVSSFLVREEKKSLPLR